MAEHARRRGEPWIQPGPVQVTTKHHLTSILLERIKPISSTTPHRNIMEPVSLGISIASIASILHTCLAGYRALNTSLGLGHAAVGLNLRFRVEQMRLELWARSRGFDVCQAENPSMRLAEPVKGDVLEIAPIRELVAEILGRVLQVLDQYTHIRDKYKGLDNDADAKKVLSRTGSLSLSLGQILKVKGNLSRRVQDVSNGNSLADKLRWGVKDKEALEELLEELRSFNDGLESLLPRHDIRLLSQSLMGEVIQLPNEFDQLPSLPAVSDPRTTGVMVLRRENRTNVSEKSALFSPSSDVEDSTKAEDPFVPTSALEGFTEPRMKYVHDQSQQTMEVLEVPLTRSIYRYWPPSSTNSQEYVMVEWRSQKAESAYSTISEETMAERRKHLVHLLHRTAMTNNDFRVLDCLGYTLTTGRLPHGESHPLVGIIFRIPASASKSAPPISLREVLGEAYDSEEPLIPTLDNRYCLAHILSVALYQLHCAGWIHRKISSYNILFFRDSTTNDIKFTEPFLSGWQYARPDHWARGKKVKRDTSEFVPPFGLGDLEMYVHPDRLDREKGVPLFRRSYDIYSLGVILVELAFWEPIIVLADPKEREKMVKFEAYLDPLSLDWSKAVIGVAQKELGSEMGTIYQKATLACLIGVQRPVEQRTKPKEGRRRSSESNSNPEEIRTKHDMGQLQPGIEKEFFWKVVEELGKIVPI